MFDSKVLKKDPEVSSWPFKEARSILNILQQNQETPEEIILQTGYGPSGLPHLGTFGEVLRTTLIKMALNQLTHIPVKIIAFSDDMDGLRKVPENVPNQDMLRQYIHTALSSVPDPYSVYESFSAHNNAKFRSFLDRYHFEYEFHSATHDYRTGVFNETLKKIMHKYETVRDIVLPTVGEERQQNYSPFMPVCQETKQVLQAKVLSHDPQRFEITYEHPFTKETKTTSILDGNCKLQWKVDWAMRWIALNVHYEMFGKDLVDSVNVARAVCKALGHTPPQAMVYELFLDKDNRKISKSKGNGLTFEEWLRYGNLASLALYLFQSPTKAKRLDVSVIPRVVDQYIDYLNEYNDTRDINSHDTCPSATEMENPVWFIHNANPPKEHVPLSYSTLINIAQVAQAKHVDFMWQYIQRYSDQLSPDKNPIINELAEKSIYYYQECQPDRDEESLSLTKQEYQATQDLRKLLLSLKDKDSVDVEWLENQVYEIGKTHKFTPLSDWFALIYKILIGRPRGPRLCPLIIAIGPNRVIHVLNEAMNRFEDGAAV